jgi:hypothetical protein
MERLWQYFFAKNGKKSGRSHLLCINHKNAGRRAWRVDFQKPIFCQIFINFACALLVLQAPLV